MVLIANMKIVARENNLLAMDNAAGEKYLSVCLKLAWYSYVYVATSRNDLIFPPPPAKIALSLDPRT